MLKFSYYACTFCENQRVVSYFEDFCFVKYNNIVPTNALINVIKQQRTWA